MSDDKQCQHRWVETTFADKHKEPGTYIYECQRCHKVSMTQLITESSK